MGNYCSTQGVRDVSSTLKTIGRIVEEATPDSFIFVAAKEEYPSKYEYVTVKSREIVGGMVREVDVLAQVTGLVSRSAVFRSELDLRTLERAYNAGVDDSNVLCIARTLGFLVEEAGRIQVFYPRRAIFPGNPVYLAPDDVVRGFFSYSSEEGLHMGHLLTRPSVEVNASLNGFRRHVAVIAQTGAGKSYTVGVMLEELLRLGGTVVVIDPHADYVFLSRTGDMRRHENSNRIQVFRNPFSSGRYSSKELDNIHDLVFKFSELDGDAVSQLAGIPEGWSHVRRAIRIAIRELKNTSPNYMLPDLIAKLEEHAQRVESEDQKAASRAIPHLERLRKFVKVFGDRSTSIKDEVLKPGNISVLDLSGLRDAAQDYIVNRVLEEIFSLRQRGEFEWPIFIVVEEAHRFIPNTDEKRSGGKMSSHTIRTVVSEGRKFGVFLILVTQRPSKIDSDALSQCNSQIILRMTNPKDQNAVAEASERLGKELMEDLPGLNVGEAIMVGELTRIPVIVKVRKRLTREGGADIDLVETLRQFHKGKNAELGKEVKPPRTGSYSEV